MKRNGIKSTDNAPASPLTSLAPAVVWGGSRSLSAGGLFAFAVLVADQTSKALMISVAMSAPHVISVTPFFDLRLGFNTGVSFGLFSSDSHIAPWILSAIAMAIIIVLLSVLRRSRDLTEILALGAIIGGALGNVTDRLRQGAVTDFLDFHVGNWYWPTFNLADIAITVGVGVFVFSSTFSRIPSSR